MKTKSAQFPPSLVDLMTNISIPCFLFKPAHPKHWANLGI